MYVLIVDLAYDCNEQMFSFLYDNGQTCFAFGYDKKGKNMDAEAQCVAGLDPERYPSLTKGRLAYLNTHERRVALVNAALFSVSDRKFKKSPALWTPIPI